MASENVLPRPLGPFDDIDSFIGLVAENHQPQAAKEENRVIKVSYLDFKLIPVCKEPIPTYALSFDEVDELRPVDVTKGWIRTTKQRPTGTKDNNYQHPSSRRKLRSLAEVKDHIQMNYDPETLYILIKSSEASSWDEERKNTSSQGKPNAKKAKVYSNANNGNAKMHCAEESHAKPNQNQVNRSAVCLNNLLRSSQDSDEEMDKHKVDKFCEGFLNFNNNDKDIPLKNHLMSLEGKENMGIQSSSQDCQEEIELDKIIIFTEELLRINPELLQMHLD